MATPISASGVHSDTYLSNVAQSYVEQNNKFIFDKVFPRVPVEKQFDKYYVFSREAFARDRAQKRAPLTESEGNTWEFSEDTYNCDVWAWHTDLSDQMLANADGALKVEARSAEMVTRTLQIRQENHWFETFFKTTVWGDDVTGGTDFLQWDDVTSNPINDVEDWKDIIDAATGYDPNTLILGRKAFRDLQSNPAILDRIKWTSGEVITEEILARLFGVDRIMVSRGQKLTSNEGETNVWASRAGRSALLVYTPPSPSMEVPAAGYTFVWTGVSDGEGTSVGAVRIPLPLKRGERIESQMAWGSKVVGAPLGVFIENATGV